MEDKDLTNLLLFLLVGFILWKFLKGRPLLAGTYSNEESWELKRDKEGNLINIIVHRDARES